METGFLVAKQSTAFSNWRILSVKLPANLHVPRVRESRRAKLRLGLLTSPTHASPSRPNQRHSDPAGEAGFQVRFALLTGGEHRFSLAAAQQIAQNIQVGHDTDTSLRTEAADLGRCEVPDFRVHRTSAFPSAAVYSTGSSSGSDRMTGRTITGSTR